MTRASTVVLLPCPDYDPVRVAEVVARGMEELASAGVSPAAGSCTAVRPALLKPNLLRPAAAERGVSTHPSVFSAAAAWLQRAGASVAFGDSPNGVFSQEETARRCGLLAAAAALGVPMVSFDDAEALAYPDGVQNRRFTIARAVRSAGAFINLPKLKSHSLTRITAAMKNVFGVVPGSLKAEYHVKHPDVVGFSRMIVDLNGLVASLVAPHLVIMDAVDAMEGNGPAGGDLVRLGLLLFSDDPVAADAVACRVIGQDPMSVAMIRLADEAGVGNARAERIDLRGGDLATFRPAAFAVPPRSPVDRVPRFVMRLAKDLIIAKPVIDAGLCIRCGECVKACPTTPRSLSMAARAVPRYDYGTCIRCYCCQETCPQGAISLARAPLARVFGGKGRAGIENA
jgi:uncharacterized protein (DUF362 family)/Pyruvate/2-oxoacid:ferredoxin oxidoreductase delta subunit